MILMPLLQIIQNDPAKTMHWSCCRNLNEDDAGN